jgi:hypothetical protein
MIPDKQQLEQWQDEAPEEWNRNHLITHEDMLAEAARREEEKDVPKTETSLGDKKGSTPF